MRKLKLQMQTTIDGFVAGPNGEMDWMTWNWDAALMNHVQALTDPVDTIILGRKLAEGFIPVWASRLADPKTADDAARKMVNTHKVVFTKTLEKSDWEHTDLAKGDLAEEIYRLKARAGGDIIAYGGGGFVTALINAGLIDELHLFMNPAAIGKGMTIFGGLNGKQTFILQSSKAFECGIIANCFTPAK